MSLITVENVYKAFGSNEVLKGVSLALESGRVLGMVGQNGSGKTTLFRIMLDLQTKDKGEILYQGRPFHPSILKQVGYLPEERGLFDNITIEEQVIYFGRLKGLKKKYIKSVLGDWLKRFEVKGTRKTKIKALSKGNAQKVMLIATLIHIQGEGDVIICDEPFSGLDVINQEILAQELLRLRDKGAAIIFSSHNMNNTERMCDEIIMLHDGEFKVNGTVNEVRESFGRHKLIVEGSPLTINEMKQLEGVLRIDDLGHGVVQLILTDASYGERLYQPITQGHYLPKYSHETYRLDEIFTQIAGGR